MSHYNDKSLITVGPPTPSVVKIVPNTVKSEQYLETVRVTYEMEDTKHGSNLVEIGLPRFWMEKWHDVWFWVYTREYRFDRKTNKVTELPVHCLTRYLLVNRIDIIVCNGEVQTAARDSKGKTVLLST